MKIERRIKMANGIKRFKELSENYMDNPRILRNMLKNMQELCEELKAKNIKLKTQLTWRPASDKPEHGKTVLATYLNQCGKRRHVRAFYIGQYEEEEGSEDDELCVEYCEEKDEWYLKEGWYELIDNWDTYSSVAIVEGVVDYWLPIPPAPDALPNEWGIVQ
jgi:hypothetical protein